MLLKIMIIIGLLFNLLSCSEKPIPKKKSAELEGTIMTIMSIDRNNEFKGSSLVLMAPDGYEHIIFKIKIEGKRININSAKLIDKKNINYDSVVRYNYRPVENAEIDFAFYVPKRTSPQYLHIENFIFEFK